jgi:hypothetical protein
MPNIEENIIKNPAISNEVLWEHTGSNRGPSACKADALNQLSYAPFKFWSANIRDESYSKKFIGFKYNVGLHFLSVPKTHFV